ncbi:MAG: DMT family transporter [Candidatus Hermodarchaeota archaeon]
MIISKNKSMKSNNLKPYIFISIAIVCWGLSSTFIELGLNSMHFAPFLFYRFSISMIILTPLIIIKKRRQTAILFKNKIVWFIGIFESLGLIFQYIGQELQIPAGLTTLITIMYAIMVPFFSYIFLKQRLKLYHLVAVLTGFIGIFFIISEGDLNFLKQGSLSLIGILMLIAAAGFFGLYITFTSYIQKSTDNKIDSISLFYVMLVIVTLFSVLSMIITGIYVLPSKDTWIWLFNLIIFSTIIAFYMYFISMKTISANQVSLLLLLQVIIPFIIDIFLFGRNYHLFVLIGSIILFVSILFSTLISNLSKELDTSSIG